MQYDSHSEEELQKGTEKTRETCCRRVSLGDWNAMLRKCGKTCATDLQFILVLFLIWSIRRRNNVKPKDEKFLPHHDCFKFFGSPQRKLIIFVHHKQSFEFPPKKNNTTWSYFTLNTGMKVTRNSLELDIFCVDVFSAS